MRSPIGEGALRGFPPSVLIVAERRGLTVKGAVLHVGLTAVFGGGSGGDTARVVVSIEGLNALLRESLRKTLVPRSVWASRSGTVGPCEENR